MKKFSSIAACVVAGAVVTGLCQMASAVNTFTESTDVGSLPATASVPAGLNPLNSIAGHIGPAASDPVDMFKIMIDDPSLFSATVSAVSDTLLFLFDKNGMGVLRNDEGQGGGHDPAFPLGSLTGKPAGVYFLAITPYTIEPKNALGLIFPTSYGAGDLDGPTGPGGGSPLTEWTAGTTTDEGSYTIRLTGARSVTAVPEPVTGSLSLLGLGALALATIRRRAASK